MKTNLYLDTSIPSAYFDISKPARQIITQKWFELDSEHYNLFVSVITIEEIEQQTATVTDHDLRDSLQSLFSIGMKSKKKKAPRV